jgi:hypothetical protein
LNVQEIDVSEEYKKSPMEVLKKYSLALPEFDPHAAEESPFFRAMFMPPSLDIDGPIEIPKDVHLVEYDEEDTREYPLFKYINLLTIIETIRPRKIYMHCFRGKCAGGRWWTLASRFVTVVSVPDHVHEIFGVPVKNHAHVSDVIRMHVIYKHGGIYVDGDVIMVRPIDDLLAPRIGQNFISPWEFQGSTIGQSVFMAPPHSPFLHRWIEAYRYFRDDCWVCHSVLLGGMLAKTFPSEINALKSQSFLRPLYNELPSIFGNKTYNFEEQGNYGMHLWCSAGACRDYLDTIKLPADLARFDNST